MKTILCIEALTARLSDLSNTILEEVDAEVFIFLGNVLAQATGGVINNVNFLNF